MGALEEAVREIIADTYGSVPKLANAIGMHPQTIYSALRNGITGASVATVMPIAAALRIDPIKLTQNIVERMPEETRGYVDVPLCGSIAAGTPREAIESEERFPIPAPLAEKYPSAFLLRVSGESVNRVLPDGCYALVKPCVTFDINNELYAVAVGQSEATIKRVKLLANGVMLQPDSTDPTFRPQVFDYADENSEAVSPIGRVVWFCSPLSWTSD